jgi:hypothetical protein
MRLLMASVLFLLMAVSPEAQARVSFTGWSSVGTARAASAPSAITYHGNLWIVYRGTDGRLFAEWTSDLVSWSTPVALRSNTPTDGGVALYADKFIYVFARRTSDGHIVETSFSDPAYAEDWRDVGAGGVMAAGSNVALATFQTDFGPYVYITVRGTDEFAWTNYGPHHPDARYHSFAGYQWYRSGQAEGITCAYGDEPGLRDPRYFVDRNTNQVRYFEDFDNGAYRVIPGLTAYGTPGAAVFKLFIDGFTARPRQLVTALDSYGHVQVTETDPADAGRNTWLAWVPIYAKLFPMTDVSAATYGNRVLVFAIDLFGSIYVDKTAEMF